MSERRGTRWLDADQQASWRAFVVGITLLLDRLDADLQHDFDLSLTEYEILVRLSERPTGRCGWRSWPTLSPTAGAGSPTPSTRMEKAGLVVRCASPEDGRGIVCRLTDQGLRRC